MSSSAFSVSRNAVLRPDPSPPAGRSTRPSASAAAAEALGNFGAGDFTRTGRSRAQESQREKNDLAQGVDEILDLARSFPWRKALFAVIGLGLVSACAIPVAMFLTRPVPPCELHDVCGNVVFGKAVPVGARITLIPKDGSWRYDAFPTATVGADGWFRVGTFRKDDGAPAGTYVATVQWFPIATDGTVGRNVLPPRYASPNTSPLTVSVSAESTILPPLRINR